MKILNFQYIDSIFWSRAASMPYDSSFESWDKIPPFKLLYGILATFKQKLGDTQETPILAQNMKKGQK